MKKESNNKKSKKDSIIVNLSFIELFQLLVDLSKIYGKKQLQPNRKNKGKEILKGGNN